MFKKQVFLRVLSALLLSVLLLMTLSACVSWSFMDGTLRRHVTAAFLDDLLADRYDEAFDLLEEDISEEDFRPLWQDLRTLAEGATAYELQPKGWNVRTSDDVQIGEQKYLVTLNNGRTIALITAFRSDGDRTLAGLHFRDATHFLAQSEAYIPVVSMVFHVLSVLFFGFLVWMLVDCIRRKIAYKPLWIAIILFGLSLSLTAGDLFTIGGGFSFLVNELRISADPFTYSVSLSLAFPVGAMVYCALRRRLTLPPEPEGSPTPSA